MIFLTTDEIIILHSALIKKTGGLDGLRDFGLLESAILSVHASFGGIDKYPTVEEKSARIAYSLANNHPFLDGNKRIAILSMLTTLSLNKIKLKFAQCDSIALGINIADGSWDYDNILQWIMNHK